MRLPSDQPKWQADVVRTVARLLQNDPSWGEAVRLCLWGRPPHPGLHLAIFIEPFLQFILGGQKTLEARFSSRRIAPFGVVQAGDIVLLKQSGGPVRGAGLVGRVWQYASPLAGLEMFVIKHFGEALRLADCTFREASQPASHVTVIEFSSVRRLPPVRLRKADRRGWVVLQEACAQAVLF